MTKTELNEKLSVLNSNFNVALLFTGNLEKEFSKNATIEVLNAYANKINELAESLKCRCVYEEYQNNDKIKVFCCSHCENLEQKNK